MSDTFMATLGGTKKLLTVSRKIFKHQLRIWHRQSEIRFLLAYIGKIDSVRPKLRRKMIPKDVQKETKDIIQAASIISNGYPIKEVPQFKSYDK
jgi:hypothetical protein